MGKFGRWLSIAAVSIGCGSGVLACGGADDAVVVRVGQGTITRFSVDHWMKVLIAGDYREKMGKPAPSGLVSDPPNYGACIRAANTLVPRHDPQATAVACRELDQAARAQAVAFLADALWHKEDAREHGETATTTEISRRLQRIRKSEFPAPGEFQRYLGEVHRTLADERYLLERNVLSDKLEQRLQDSGLKPGDNAAIARVADAWVIKWTARTSCAPGYITSRCKQYRGTESVGPSPRAALEKLSGQT
jgi:hypothetical protein